MKIHKYFRVNVVILQYEDHYTQTCWVCCSLRITYIRIMCEMFHSDKCLVVSSSSDKQRVTNNEWQWQTTSDKQKILPEAQCMGGCLPLTSGNNLYTGWLAEKNLFLKLCGCQKSIGACVWVALVPIREIRELPAGRGRRPPNTLCLCQDFLFVTRCLSLSLVVCHSNYSLLEHLSLWNISHIIHIRVILELTHTQNVWVAWSS